jgi:hypothetical protein
MDETTRFAEPGHGSASSVVRTIRLAVACAALAACTATPIPPTYTQAELAETCVRNGGWWRPSELRGGYCEYQAPEN